jgi:hypothetical protein
LGKLRSVAEALDFMAVVVMVDWLHFLFGVIVWPWVGDLWSWWRICNLWS